MHTYGTISDLDFSFVVYAYRIIDTYLKGIPLPINRLRLEEAGYIFITLGGDSGGDIYNKHQSRIR